MTTRTWLNDDDGWLADRDASTLIIGGMGFFAVGALVGVGLGLLLAPKSGEDLRHQLGLAGRRNRLPAGNRQPDLDMSPAYGTQTTPPGTR